MGFKIKNGILLKYESSGALARLGIRRADETVSVPRTVTDIADEAFSMSDVCSVQLPITVKPIWILSDLPRVSARSASMPLTAVMC